MGGYDLFRWFLGEAPNGKLLQSRASLDCVGVGA